MENLIELALFAAAAYGVKNYLFTPIASDNVELFSSRAAIVAKRLVSEQSRSFTKSEAGSAGDKQEQLDAVDIETASESEFVAVSEDSEIAEASIPAMNGSEICGDPNERQDAKNESPEFAAAPEDSVLKRHYFTELAAQRSVAANPYPTDSVLCRHYQQRQSALLDLTAINEQVELISPPTCNESVSQNQPETSAKPVIPEDSVLRRHTLSLIRHEIENQYPSCPSEAVLRRHYHQLVQSQFDAYLAELVSFSG